MVPDYYGGSDGSFIDGFYHTVMCYEWMLLGGTDVLNWSVCAV